MFSKIWKKLSGKPDEEIQQQINQLNSMVVSLYQKGQHEEAIKYTTKSANLTSQIKGKQHPDFALSLNNLAELYRSIGDYAAAEPLLKQAMKIYRVALGKRHPLFATSVHNLAALYQSMGDYVAAEGLFKQAMEIRRIALGEQHPDFAGSLNNLAILYDAIGDYAAAEPLLKQAMEIYRVVLGEPHPSFAMSLNNKASLFAATGREADAKKMMEQALAIDDRMIGQVFSISSEKQRTAYLKTISHHRDSLLSLVTQSLSTSPEAVRSAFSLVLRRKAIEAEALATQRDAVLGGKYPEVASKLQEITTLRAQIAQKTLAGPGKVSSPTHQELLAEWNAQKERLEAEVARQVPEMNLEQKLRSIDHQVVAMSMQAGATLVEFVRFEVYDFKAVRARGELQWKPARYVAFIMPSGEPNNIEMIDLGEAGPVDQMIATFREVITAGKEDRSSRGLGSLSASAHGAMSEAIGITCAKRSLRRSCKLSAIASG